MSLAAKPVEAHEALPLELVGEREDGVRVLARSPARARLLAGADVVDVPRQLPPVVAASPVPTGKVRHRKSSIHISAATAITALPSGAAA
jgi:hypothetical protein